MKVISRFYQFLQNLSIDVAIGAMAMSYLFAKVTHVEMKWEIYAVLGVCVWLIYTFDHLLDAKRMKGLAKTRRHRFHQLYYDELLISWLLFFTVALLLAIFFLPLVIWKWGMVVVSFSTLHLVLVHYFGSTKSKLVLKELGGAWNYSAGIVIAPFALATSFEWVYLLSFLLLFLVALFNLVMFSYFDYQKDIKNEYSSIAINYGIVPTRNFMYGLFGMLVVLTSGLLVFVHIENFAYYLTTCFLFSIGLFYFLMVVLIDYRSHSETYRKLGDMVFLLPLLLLLV